jgi:hypothetical protein
MHQFATLDAINAGRDPNTGVWVELLVVSKQIKGFLKAGETQLHKLAMSQKFCGLDVLKHRDDFMHVLASGLESCKQICTI